MSISLFQWCYQIASQSASKTSILFNEIISKKEEEEEEEEEKETQTSWEWSWEQQPQTTPNECSPGQNITQTDK